MMRLAGLVITWAITATVAGLILWVPLGGVGHALAGPLGAAGIVPAALALSLYAPYIGLRALGYGAPCLALLFALWALLCLRRPSLDSPKPLALFALLIALPGSCLVSALMAREPAGFSWSAFAWILPFYSLVLWGAILFPRWLVEPLALGAFSQPGTRAHP